MQIKKMFKLNAISIGNIKTKQFSSFSFFFFINTKLNEKILFSFLTFFIFYSPIFFFVFFYFNFVLSQ